MSIIVYIYVHIYTCVYAWFHQKTITVNLQLVSYTGWVYDVACNTRAYKYRPLYVNVATVMSPTGYNMHIYLDNFLMCRRQLTGIVNNDIPG